jgi:DNA-binding NtrC family response regulator
LKALVYEAVTRHSQGILSMDTFLKAMGNGVNVHKAPSLDTEIIARSASGERLPTLDEAEDLLVAQAMRLAKNNQGIAAGYLGINRSALNKKLLKKKSVKNAA